MERAMHSRVGWAIDGDQIRNELFDRGEDTAGARKAAE